MMWYIVTVYCMYKQGLQTFLKVIVGHHVYPQALWLQTSHNFVT